MAYGEAGTGQKSKSDLKWLGSVLIQHPLFKPEELSSFDPAAEKHRLDRFLQTKDNAFCEEHGWYKSSLKIALPFEGCARAGGEDNAPKLTVDFFHQKISDIMKSALRDSVFATYNTTPFEQRWKSADGHDLRVYSELYSSDAVLEAYHEVNGVPNSAGNNYEHIVVPIMLSFDATLLSNFGDASLWPIYLFIGNQSKYICAKPTMKVCHHLAYIPKLPDRWQNTYTEIYKKPPTKDVHTHMKRELVHAVWALLLRDEDFQCAYKDGILRKCSDDIVLQALIQICTYTGDYPEKAILCSIKNLGRAPCPRCLILMGQLAKMGMKLDMRMRVSRARIDSIHRQNLVEKARTRIFKKGCSVNSKAVTSLLGDQLYVPTRASFLLPLLLHGINYFELFPVDLLHEFELSVWKAVFIHLVRMVMSLGGTAVQDVNDRYVFSIFLVYHTKSGLGIVKSQCLESKQSVDSRGTFVQ
ncbi:hypothetical protein CONPUDRAFT_59130 [Coniophora puteana RWD-64-598 SS2]|uniref:Uncharacterized protein n=1 Tax=Coniophora puteana (strain RWD-64-598) TaxID=741705 RepID=A0A5M3MJX9_CONPW|nr:uncharacterized protein CONPUDRAFT_59130 [Coniophora puteana RWD-64-598 SS2]EIW78901.1 hypothetical protein CONPUDRAFT_59130 [Coniophora puteana RWD-64-598 SS2]